MAKTDPIDPNVPAGSEDPKLGNDRIQELARAVAELLNVDHYMGTDGGAGTGYNEDAAGRHNKVTLRVQTSNPTSVADTIISFAKDVDGKAEAHLKDEDGNVIQLTTAGKIKKSYLEDNSFVPAGAYLPFAGSTAPAGWLMCNGQAVSRTTYAALFAVCGTTYGVGDGTTTFNVPNMIGRVPIGEDVAGIRVASNNLLGQTGGSSTHTLTIAQMPAHTHGLDYDSDSFTPGSAGGINDTGSGSWDTGSTGGGGSHNNMQPYQVGNYIIKT
jgi:microcystin-dependent protein